MSDLDVVHHAAADEADHPAHRGGNVHHLLDAVNRGGKAGDEHLARRRATQFLDARPNGALRGRVAWTLDVGAVAEQRQHPLMAVAGKSVQIERLTVAGRVIHRKVAAWYRTPECG